MSLINNRIRSCRIHITKYCRDGTASIVSYIVLSILKAHTNLFYTFKAH